MGKGGIELTKASVTRRRGIGKTLSFINVVEEVPSYLSSSELIAVEKEEGQFELWIGSSSHQPVLLLDEDGGITLSKEEIKSLYEANANTNSLTDDKNAILEDILSGESSLGVNGSVFITDINPQGSGNVGNKVRSSDGVVLDSCVTDTPDIEIEVLALPGNTNWQPGITINETPVSMTAQGDQPLFHGTLAFQLSGEEELTVKHEDGAEHTVTISADVPPEIITANFTGGYPGNQTELKAGDTFDFFVEANEPVIAVEIQDFEAFEGQTFSVSSDESHTVTGTIADRGDSAQNQRARVRVQKSTGSWSTWWTTEIGENGEDHVVLNNRHPSFQFNSISYPSGQEALKGSEEADVDVEVQDFDVIEYTSPNGDLTVTDPTTYSQIKTVERVGGVVNLATNNFRIEATREANDATNEYQNVVQIVNEPAQLTNPGWVQVRSGVGAVNISTNYDQPVAILSASVPSNRGQLGSESPGSGWNTSYTFPITATESDTHNDNTVDLSIEIEGLSGITNNVTKGYRIKGFAERTLILQHDEFIKSIGVNVVNETNTIVSGQILSSPPFTIATERVNEPSDLNLANQYTFINNGNQIQIAEQVTDFGYAPGTDIEIKIEET